MFSRPAIASGPGRAPHHLGVRLVRARPASRALLLTNRNSLEARVRIPVGRDSIDMFRPLCGTNMMAGPIALYRDIDPGD